MGGQESKLTKGIQTHRFKALVFAINVLSALAQNRLFTAAFCIKLLRYLTGLYENLNVKSESIETASIHFFSSTICTYQKQNVKLFMSLKRHFSFLCYRYRARIMRSTNWAQFQRTPEGRSLIQEKCNDWFNYQKIYFSNLISGKCFTNYLFSHWQNIKVKYFISNPLFLKH